jgi:CRP-like cAMP-binding protein
LIDVLKKSVLFRNFNEEQIKHIVNFFQYKIVEYSKGQTIILEDDHCDSLGIILEGRVELQTIFGNGNVITHLELAVSDIFGEALLFSKHNNYPVYVQAATNAKIMFVSKEKLMHGLLHHPLLLQNFLALLSNKLYVMNNKVKVLSLDSIRKKVSYFLLQQYKQQKNTFIKCILNRKQMAEHLAVQRPSLSRELIKMKEDGLIDFEDKNFIILDLDRLEEQLF